jgi:8-oxo-dGTP pyrophosphatase MutT (NUDIX family)
VVVRCDGDRRSYLLIRDRHRNWGFPKGHVERGETDQVAARREVREETGLDGLALRGDAGTIEWTFRRRGRVVRKRCRFFVFEAANGATRPRRSEGITACRWLPLRDALAKLTFESARGVLSAADTLLGREPSGP